LASVPAAQRSDGASGAISQAGRTETRGDVVSAPTIDAPTIAAVRERYKANLADYPRFCTCLRETFAEFTSSEDHPAESQVKTSADAAACFPEFNPHTVADAWCRAVRVWASWKTGATS
jgi:hypothetical protein